MEPQRCTDLRLHHIEKELLAREPIFHHRELGASQSSLEEATEESFWEVGASGRRYSRQFVIETVLKRWSEQHEDEWQLSEPYCQELAKDLYLLTYTLQQGARVSHRSTLWRQASGSWKIVFHQGTVVEIP
ncbi:MAG TPA: DUF4440 domain-containing protein [Noviherbaspirillum sp.]